eukprot:1027726-Rhodomonas_salina.2
MHRTRDQPLKAPDRGCCVHRRRAAPRNRAYPPPSHPHPHPRPHPLPPCPAPHPHHPPAHPHPAPLTLRAPLTHPRPRPRPSSSSSSSSSESESSSTTSPQRTLHLASTGSLFLASASTGQAEPVLSQAEPVQGNPASMPAPPSPSKMRTPVSLSFEISANASRKRISESCEACSVCAILPAACCTSCVSTGALAGALAMTDSAFVALTSPKSRVRVLT